MRERFFRGTLAGRGIYLGANSITVSRSDRKRRIGKRAQARFITRMNTATPNASAHFEHGRVILDEAVDWPDGTQLLVQPAANGAEDSCSDGRPWPKTKEQIDAWLAEFDALPAVFTGEEFERFERERIAEKDRQKALAARSWREAGEWFPS